MVLFNLWAAHYDADLWPEPQRFDPSRFLDKDGFFAPEKLDNVIAFSVGELFVLSRFNINAAKLETS